MADSLSVCDYFRARVPSTVLHYHPGASLPSVWSELGHCRFQLMERECILGPELQMTNFTCITYYWQNLSHAAALNKWELQMLFLANKPSYYFVCMKDRNMDFGGHLAVSIPEEQRE